MLKNLFRKKTRKTFLGEAMIPEGRRVYAIGDVHGRKDLLQILLKKIAEDDTARGGQSEIIFLGDLIDRGPDSCGVVDMAMQLQSERGNVRFLMGNHEEVFLACMKGSDRATRFFTRIGGKETILSYEISMKEYMELDNEALTARLPEIIPQSHVDFVRNFEDQIVIGDYAFVHAGIRPDVPLAEQKPKDLHWIREDFLSAGQLHEKMIIYGHTINEEVVEADNRIGIDTGAYYTENLTAIALEGRDRWYLDTRDT
ncbi:serine/threonine protein phosphatase 1 [Parasphingorhabdus marina DSM 22363]|uniref:Serine/threonine protein phosphatase 1 n=1 Tax=Parasphingorhabdus marina DSM 22363 TaxID=1123272 RepID=A0A1N6EYV4_9SPHN|nr:metallophosphoesterase family protein [Parasphingorhabdus marina]SIN88157.1 serine/threonine protein phosphatase 1 [Parasphingorhabdus marina DSM 22363]